MTGTKQDTAASPNGPALSDQLGHTPEAVKLAKRMAKAAGPQRADTMASACYMLLCTAAMVQDEKAYFDWLERMKEKDALHSCTNAFSQHPGKCLRWCGDAQAASSGVRAA